MIENQQDREDSRRDLEPGRRKEHEQGELENEAKSVHVGLKITKSEQEKENNGRALELEPRNALIRTRTRGNEQLSLNWTVALSTGSRYGR